MQHRRGRGQHRDEDLDNYARNPQTSSQVEVGRKSAKKAGFNYQRRQSKHPRANRFAPLQEMVYRPKKHAEAKQQVDEQDA
jgi:hypothetical protein